MADDLLLIRRNGDRLEAIDVPGAMAWSTETQRQLDALCDLLGATRGDSGDNTTTLIEPT